MVADEPTAPMITDTPTDLPPPPSPTPEFIDDKEDVHSKSADFIDIPDSPKQEYFGESNFNGFMISMVK